MKHVDPKQTEFAFVFPETPMFSHLITELDTEETLPATRKRDMVSGLRRVSNGLNRAPDEVPADPKWLQPRIVKVAPAALGLSPKSWQNAVSDARSAMAHFGIVKRRHRHIDDLSPAWRTLWERVLASKDKTLSLALPRFVHYLNRVGVAPQEVTQAHADSFLEAIIANEISKSPEVGWINAINAWNLATTRIENWPQITLEKPRRQKVYKRADADLPAGFMADLTALMQRMAQPDPFAEDEPTRPLRPHTITAYTRQLKRFASELLEAGVPPEDITSVAALCEPKRAEIGLRAMFERNGNEKNKLIAETAALLRNLASKLDLGDDVRKQLAQLSARVSMPKQKGMTRKNRDRLRVLQDDKTLQRLLVMPEKIFAKPAGKTKPYYAALAREDALAVAILLCFPLRIKNIASIHIEQHLQNMGDGRLFLVMNEDDTKTETPIEMELPKDVAKMLKEHLTTRAPLLCPKGTVWLFPRRDGMGPITGNALSARLKKRIRVGTGIEMNSHLFRHLAAMIWLDENPGAYEVARRILGHSTSSHTINMYSGLETRSAMDAFGTLLAKKKGPQK